MASALTVPPHDALAHEWAKIRDECRRTEHPYHHKSQSADLWIAATARLVGVLLITHDTGFVGVPGLEVICRA